MSGHGEFDAAIDGLRGLEESSPQYRHEALEVYGGILDDGGIARTVELRAVPAGASSTVEAAFTGVVQSWWSVSDLEGVTDLLRWGPEPRPWALVADDGEETLATAWETVDDEAATDIVTAVGETLAAASAEEVMHGNLRPAHVRLPEGERAALVDDWGVGRAVATAREGEFVTGFTAPEQLDGSAADGAAVDTYGLAALAYFALTERPPFPEERAAVLGERPQPVAALRPDLPAAVGDLVMRGLRSEPGERPDGPGAFAAAFEDAMAGDESGGRHGATGAAGAAAGGVAAGGAADAPDGDGGAGGEGGDATGTAGDETAADDAGAESAADPPSGEESAAEPGPLAGGDSEPFPDEEAGPLAEDSGPLAEDSGPLADDSGPLAEDDSEPLGGDDAGPPDESTSVEEGSEQAPDSQTAPAASGQAEPEDPAAGGRAEPEAEVGGRPAEPAPEDNPRREPAPESSTRAEPVPEDGDKGGGEADATDDDGSRVSRRTVLAGGGLLAALAAVGAGAWAFLGSGGGSGGADLSVVPDRAETLAAVDVAGLRESDALTEAVNARLPLSLPLLDADTLAGVLEGVATRTGMDPDGVQEAVLFAARSAGPETYAAAVLETEWDGSTLRSSLEDAGESVSEETYADSRLLVAEYPDLAFPVTVGEVEDGRYAVGTRPEVEDVLETASGSTPSVEGREVEAFRAAAEGQVRVGSLLPPEVVSAAVPGSVPEQVAAALTETARNVEYVSGSMAADGEARLRAEAGSAEAAETAAAQLRAASTLAADELARAGTEGALATLAGLLEEATVSQEDTTVTVSLSSAYELLAAALAAAE